MKIDDFLTEPLDENISINLTKSQKARWERIKEDFKRFKLKAKLNPVAREKILEIMNDAENAINEHKKKNLILD